MITITKKEIRNICSNFMEKNEYLLDDLIERSEYGLDNFIDGKLRVSFINDSTYRYILYKSEMTIDEIYEYHDEKHHPVIELVNNNARKSLELLKNYKISEFRLERKEKGDWVECDLNKKSFRKELQSIKSKIEKLYKVECIMVPDVIKYIYFYIIYP